MPAPSAHAPKTYYNRGVREDFRGEPTETPRRAYEELLASEVRYRTVIEQSPLSIHVFSPDGTSLLANASWNQLWNLKEDEKPEGHNVFDDEQLRATGLAPSHGSSPSTRPGGSRP